MASKSAARAPSAASQRTAPAWAVFACERRAFGFPLDRVREIVMPRPFSRLPGCGPEVCGLIGLRGRIVTVFDLGAALGLRRAAGRPDHRVVLVEHRDRLVAVAVERVAAVRRAPVRRLGRRRAVLDGLRLERDAVLGIGEAGGEPFLALDSDRILDGLLL